MRTGLVSASLTCLSLGLILTAIATVAAAGDVADDDAGGAIVTIGRRCTPSAATGVPAGMRRFSCAAVYRNDAERPVFDIRIHPAVDGRPATVFRRGWIEYTCCPDGTRQALAAGESALWRADVDVPAAAPGGADAGELKLTYEAAAEGPETALDVPRPELQYVDLSVHDGRADIVGEVRNTDGRTWYPSLTGEVGDEDFAQPVVAWFHRGALSGVASAPRLPDKRIASDGRYIFGLHDVDVSGGIDRLEVFWRDAYAGPYGGDFFPGRWELLGFDHAVELDETGQPRLSFRATVRNPTAHMNRGAIWAIARRADFHTIGVGKCTVGRNVPRIDLADEVAPGASADCAGVITLLPARPDAALDDVRVVTVELGEAWARPITPTPTSTATPCPALATPAPVATLPSVARTLFFPWSIRMLAERCP
ncbi:MAG: hypothetical protein ABI780_09165 [Ardenticatenales bacterium]